MPVLHLSVGAVQAATGTLLGSCLLEMDAEDLEVLEFSQTSQLMKVGLEKLQILQVGIEFVVTKPQ